MYEQLELPVDFPTTRVLKCNTGFQNAICTWPVVVDISTPAPGMHFEGYLGHENGEKRHTYNYWVVTIMKGKKRKQAYANVRDLNGQHIMFVDPPFIDRKLKKYAKRTNSVILEVQSVE